MTSVLGDMGRRLLVATADIDVATRESGIACMNQAKQLGPFILIYTNRRVFPIVEDWFNKEGNAQQAPERGDCRVPKCLLTTF